MTEQSKGTSAVQETERKPSRSGWPVALLSILVVVGIPFLWYLLPAVQAPLMYLAILLGVIGLFPVSYLTYRAFGEPVRRQRLKNDFRLLGLVDEAELEDTVEKLYRDTYNPLQFVAYIALILVVSLTMLLLYRYRAGVGVVDAATLSSMFYAFLGAYVFGVQQLVRRYSTMDIQPQLYSAVLMRMIVAVGVVFVAATVITAGGGEIAADDPAQAAGWAAVLAFLIGLFPSEGLRWISKKAALVFTSTPFDRANELPVRTLLGISAWHEARLNELGIDDAQNLATVDLRKLLLTTQFDTQQIVHWVDQAILHCKVGSKIDRYREAGVVTFHDLRMVLAMPGTHLQSLVTLLGGNDAGDLEHVGDYSNYPNYAYILEYYTRSRRVARLRAEEGEDLVLGVQQDQEDEEGYRQRVKYGWMLKLSQETDTDVLISLADAYYHLSRLVAAEKEANQELALQMVERALALDSDLVDGYYWRSLVRLEQGKWDEVVKDASEVLRLGNEREMRLLAAHNRGLAYSMMGYFDLALKDFDRVLAEEDRQAETYLWRGITYNALSKFEAAVQDFRFAYLLGQDNATLWSVWGAALIGLNRSEEAVEKLSRAIQLEADNFLAYTRRGYAYMQRGNDFYAQARRDFETAVDLNGQYFEAWANLGYLELRAENWQKAAECCEKAISLNSYWLSWFHLAKAYQKLGRDEEARDAYQKVIELAPPGALEAKEAQARVEELSQGPTDMPAGSAEEA